MGMLSTIRQAIRSFILGPGVVEMWETTQGHDKSQFAPPEYGDYIATSNGVYACVTLRADLLASLPLKLYKVKSNGDRTEVVNGPLLALLTKVNPFWTMNRLLQMIEMSLGIWGECFLFLERGDSGKLAPREIWWGRPDRVKVIPHETDYISGFLYEPVSGAAPIHYNTDEVIWLRYPNPIDEYSGLSPLAAARLAADYSSAAMKSNAALFQQGMQMGGAVMPKGSTTLTPDQAKDLEEALDRRFRGVDKAHRWGVFRFEVQMSPYGVTPKDAEFLGGLKWALEDICRAYKVPMDLVGGQRTYENVNAALKAVWTHCIVPEGRFIASEFTEQLLPMFPAQADLVELDTGGVDVLQEDRAEIIGQVKTLWDMGVPLNPLLQEFLPALVPAKAGYAWGNVWWAPATLMPISTAEPPALPAPEPPTPEPPADEEPPAPERSWRSTRSIAFGSPEHERLFRRAVRRAERHEQRIAATVASLFRRQQDSILAKLKQRGHRAGEDPADGPFEIAEWIKKFRIEIRPLLSAVVLDAGGDALDDLALGMAFDVKSPQVLRYIERRAQRFAVEVNQTTWEALRAGLGAGIDAGKTIAELEEIVTATMGTRIRSSETIARTETNGAMNGGTLLAWRQSGVVSGKTWLAALDDRTRESHSAAHGQTVGLDENFEVGGATGPGPGQMGASDEDINCRCSMTAVLAEGD